MKERKKIKLFNGGNMYEIIFAYCPPGHYRITNRPNLASRNAEVELSKAFWMQETTVSLGLYEFVFGKAYYNYKFNDFEKSIYPWNCIDFKEINEFIHLLNNIILSNGHQISMDIPSVIEWEHALLCGTDNFYSWGNDESKFGEYAWYLENSDDKVHFSKQKKCNDWGLYDMYGNIHEYCYDCSFYSNTSFFLDPPIIIPSNEDVVPCMGGAYNSTTAMCSMFNVLGYFNQYLEPAGFRLIIRQ